MELIQILPQERILQRTAEQIVSMCPCIHIMLESVEHFPTTHRGADRSCACAARHQLVPLDRIQQRTVGVPVLVPQIMEELAELSQLASQEHLKLCTMEQVVDVRVPLVMNDITEVVESWMCLCRTSRRRSLDP